VDAVLVFFRDLVGGKLSLFTLVIVALVVGHIFTKSTQVTLRLIELIGIREQIGLMFMLFCVTMFLSISVILSLHSYFEAEAKEEPSILYLILLIVTMLVVVWGAFKIASLEALSSETRPLHLGTFKPSRITNS
jgi:hypothetical protein